MKPKEYFQFFSSRFAQAFFVWKQVAKIIWKVNKNYLLLMFAANILLGLSTLPVFIIEKNIIDAIVQNVGNPAWESVLTFLLVLIFARASLNFFQALLRRLLRFLERSLSRLFSAELEILMGRKMVEMDMAVIETPEFKDRFDRIQRESGRRAWALVAPLGSIVGQISGLISALSLLIVFKPLVALLVFFLSLPELLVDARFIKERYRFITWSALKNRLWGYTAYYLVRARNFFEVKLLNVADYLTRKLKKLQSEVLGKRIDLMKRRQSSRAWSSLPLAFFLLGFYVYLAILAILAKISVGSVEMYIRAASSFQINLSSLAWSVLEFYENYLYVQDLVWFLNLEPKVKHGQKEIGNKFKEGIKVKNLWFRYLTSRPWIIKGIDFEVKPGETVAIVGENGAGKTTLVKLLCRFYDPSKGEITLEGINVKDLKRKNLYRQFSVLFQDFQGFAFSARESIGIGSVNKINDLEEVKKWAKKAQIHEFINSLPAKYENPLMRDFKNGIEPSFGQWQRIGLARALIKQAPVIILDEPTSNVDSTAEEKIFAEIKKMAGKKRILILISHRFSTVRRADKIYVIDKGKFIEKGTHHELMKLNGKYAKLFLSQAKYYQD